MKNMDFEEAMKKLEEIANELENNELSLEESISKFEEGMELSKQCNEIIEKAEKKITILLKNDENMREEDFKIEEKEENI